MAKERDYLTRNYQGKLVSTLKETLLLESVGKALAIIRNDDYNELVKQHLLSHKKTSNHERRKYIVDKYGINKREADCIVYSNNEQYDLTKRTTEENIKNWKWDISRLEKKRNNLHGYKKQQCDVSIDILNSKINKAQKRFPSVCFGGNKLQKEITQHPENISKRISWNKKRMFLGFLGESGKIGGNSHVKLCPKTGCVTLCISEGLMKLSCLQNRKIVVGNVLFKNGNKSIYSSIENRIAIGYQFIWDNNKNIWRIHSSVRLEKPDKKSSSRICGIDHNAGFLSATIVDKHANVVSKMEFKYSHSRDIPQLCHDIIQWCEFHKCFTISIEKLKGLHKSKRKTKSSAKKLNNVLNRICSLAFSTKMKNVCDTQGVTLKVVSPYKTSRATVQWSEDIFGVTTHEKASYLIARRGMGLSIDRRPRKTPLNNSVCSEVYLDSWLNHIVV